MPYKSRLFIFLVFYFTLLTIWWVKYNFFFSFEAEGYFYNIAYGFMALIGALYGFSLYKSWGGLRTLVGKALFLLSLGLFAEWVANIIWGYFNIVKQIEVPYPSVADIFFFSIIPIYFAAIVFLAKASGAVLLLKKITSILVAILIPLFMLTIAYYLFFREGLEFSDPIRIFFDISYPLGYSITFSITMIVYILTKNQLGGMMRKVVLFVLGAYLFQFVADYTFLYQALKGTYVNGGLADFLYSIALFAMPVALINFNSILKKFKSELTSNIKPNIIIGNNGVKDERAKIYIEIVKSIITDQEKIIGPLAIEYAKKVSGLNIKGERLDNLEINISKAAPEVLRNLVEAYKEIFGNASVSVVKESIAKVLQSKPEFKNIIGSL